MPTSSTDRAECLLDLLTAGGRSDRVVHVRRLAGREARYADLPPWTPPAVRAALARAGLERLWSHQREAAEAADAGEHVVLSTGTASGKSLGFLLPTLTAVIEGAAAPTGRGATALYLAPTKALAHDQLARLQELAVPGLRVAAYDGDTPPQERRWARDHAAYLLTNPDMLHHSILPAHEHWGAFLRALRYVVVDECHVYRGVFGSHLALVLRRLRRVAARYRAHPVFLLASATVADPAGHGARLVGMPVRAVTDDGSPRAAMTVALWQPPVCGVDVGAPGSGGRPAYRRSAVAETAQLLADLVGADVQSVAFARSRVGVEAIATAARRTLQTRRPQAVERVAAYRGGYLPEERRALESGLRSGSLTGLAATTALELGIDISGLDAVVLAGWPGTRSSFWQQVGRAGRAGRGALAVLVAGDDPLDAYLVTHPEAILDHPIEAAVVDPENPYLLGPHLAAAAAELPLSDTDTELFGSSTTDVADELVDRQLLRRRPTGWYWARPDRAADLVSLRGSGRVVRIVEAQTGRLLGVVDEPRSYATVHPGAVYVHQGQTCVVAHLDLRDGVALVARGDPGWTTQARSVSTFELVATEQTQSWGPATLSLGRVVVRTRVTSFLRRLPGGEVLGEHPLDLPERTMPTQATWWTMPQPDLLGAGLHPMRLPGALHAAEHASIGLLPLIAIADRWDIGGVSTVLHPDTGLPTVLVYDGVPGGGGFARRGYAVASTWFRATLDTVRSCPCEQGCPSCIQSPKCGNGNQPLDKAASIRVLDLLLDAAQ
ncbi:MAG: DEAD/DEAH box helicase [Dermatophilaceae bacterium]